MTMPKNCDETKKKKRRSSNLMCGRRRSKSLCGLLSSKLCQTIPLDLPPEQRFRSLLRSAFQYSILTTAREFCRFDNFDMVPVIEAGKHHYDEIESVMEEGNMFKLAVTDLGDDLVNDMTIKKYVESVEKLKQECNTWESVTAEARNELVKALELGNVKETVSNDSFPDLEEYDLSAIACDVDDAIKNLVLEADAMLEVPKLLFAYVSITDKHIRNMKEFSACFSYSVEKPNVLCDKLEQMSP